MRLGCIHGRFQPFHNGHFEYLCGALMHSDQLIIGITQYDRGSTDEGSPEHRMQIGDNPSTYWQRIEIINAALRAAALSIDRLTIVPFPIQEPTKIQEFVPQDAIMYTTVYDRWNLQKIRRLRDQGFAVRILWRRRVKQFEGKTVRNAMRQDVDLLRSQVPPGAFEKIREFLAEGKGHAI